MSLDIYVLKFINLIIYIINLPIICFYACLTFLLGKSSWPELVGVKGEVAEKKVKEENPSIKSTVIVAEGSFVTLEFRCDRVRVWVDEKGFVTKVPKIG